MRKVYNFSAGPAMLPEEVLRIAQEEMLDWHGTGMSMMELGHRGAEFQALAAQTESDIRLLMSIPDHYQILFLSGGATAQFAMVPLNLFARHARADYIDTGIWSKKAIAEARRYGEINIAAELASRDQLAYIPTQQQWRLHDDAAYVHYTPNETIEGIEFNFVPQTGHVPLVADMSSMILTRPIDVAQYGIIYAGAQKNLGQAGVTVVIIRDDLIADALPMTPTLYQYQIMSKNHSFYNTPPTYSWYLMGLVLTWLKQQGGVAAMYQINQRKASKLYAAIDQSNGFYRNTIHADCRSMMNVVFTLPNDALTVRFLEQALQAGLTNLRGHRVVGGLRASLYNAMPMAGVNALLDFMQDFAKKHG